MHLNEINLMTYSKKCISIYNNSYDSIEYVQGVLLYSHLINKSGLRAVIHNSQNLLKAVTYNSHKSIAGAVPGL